MARVKKRATPLKEIQPLFGRRIIITRARSQAKAFAQAIEELGGEVVEFPTIEILPPQSYDSLDRAIQEIDNYHWVIFTSVNGVDHFLSRFRALRRNIRTLKGIKIAAIGPETAKGVESAGVHVCIVPQEYRAEAILQELKPDEMRGMRVLLPRAAEARDILPATLREWGAKVEVVEAYRTVAAQSDANWLHTLLVGKKMDMITFTSSSTVNHFAALFPGKDLKRFLAGTTVACIGPIAQKTAEEKGMRVDVVPRVYTISGLTQAIAEYFSRQ